MIRIEDRIGMYGKQKVVFRAPENRIVAATLWMFLVENLKYGMGVELDFGDVRFSWASGLAVPENVYQHVMNRAQGLQAKEDGNG